jgi:hypothetical protein
VQLLKYVEWPSDRLENNAWQQLVIETLKAQGAQAEHIRHLEAEIGAARFRPEEVAGAAIDAPPAASYASATAAAQIILSRFGTP